MENEKKMTAEPNFNLTADRSIPAGLRDLVGGNVVSFSPHSCCRYFYFYFLSRARSHVCEILQIEPRASRLMRRRAVHRMPAAKQGYDSNVCGAPSWLQTSVEAIRPFIFYALVSWLSQCWRRRDTGPTSQKPHWNYSIWIIHRTWRRYLLKGQTCLCFPLLSD